MRVVASDEAGRRRARGLDLLAERARDSRGALHVHVLSSFNLDALPPYLADALDRLGLPARVTLGSFGQLAAAILDPRSALHGAPPDVVLLVPAVDDLLEPLWSRPGAWDPEAADALVDDRLAELDQLLRTLGERLPLALAVLAVLDPVAVPAEHVLDPGAPERGQRALDRLGAGLRELAARHPRHAHVDWTRHVGPAGTALCRDERLWYLARMRLGPAGLATLGELTARYVAAARGAARKVLVVDLDDTLWGGVVGEVGLAGLELGPDGLGRAFQDVQRELARLNAVGVVLAVASKNNAEDAWEVFDRHPGMVLGRAHVAAARIDWNDKATSLRVLAEELNLGLDSFVFLDDNPAERAWIRQALPEVLVPELPDDPAERPAFVREAPWFLRVRPTAADRQRAVSYRAEAERRTLSASVSSFEEYLASLGQEVTILPLEAAGVGRAVQLCQRTNQFNLTTCRYAAGDFARLVGEPGTGVWTLAVRDRLGDSGVVGLAILRVAGAEARIDTLLLSCRVLGRRVEDAFLSFLVGRARALGARYLVGEYVPSAKNGQVAAFYADRGFAPSGGGSFSLDLAGEVPAAPAGLVLVEDVSSATSRATHA